MILPYYIAKRIHFSRNLEKKISAPAVKIATVGVAIGLAVMLITVSIVTGFKDEIRSKIVGFGSHIRISNMDLNSSYETKPIAYDSAMVTQIKQIDGVHNIQEYATKPGIIKQDGLVQGIVLKGVNGNYDWGFFNKNLLEGRVINTKDLDAKNEVLVSKYISRLLKLKLNDEFLTFFFQKSMNIRARKFKIVGIYETNFLEFDKIFVLANLSQVQKLNMWDEKHISGFEINIQDFYKLNELNDSVYNITSSHLDENGSPLLLRNIKEINPQIFGWLDLLDMNVVIILILMASVAGFNMISGLMIIILEQTNLIGILKALGSNNWLIQKIFLVQSFFIIGKGLIWGNVIAMLLMFVQDKWHILSLNPQDYYVSYVPINFNLGHILLINLCTFVLTLSIMLLPSLLITFISPAKAIKFE